MKHPPSKRVENLTTPDTTLKVHTNICIFSVVSDTGELSFVGVLPLRLNHGQDFEVTFLSEREREDPSLFIRDRFQPLLLYKSLEGEIRGKVGRERGRRRETSQREKSIVGVSGMGLEYTWGLDAKAYSRSLGKKNGISTPNIYEKYHSRILQNVRGSYLPIYFCHNKIICK